MSYEIKIIYDNFYAERVKEAKMCRGRQKEINKYKYKYYLYYFDTDENIIAEKSLLRFMRGKTGLGKQIVLNGKRGRMKRFASIDLQKVTNLNPVMLRKILDNKREDLVNFYNVVKSNLSPCWGYKPELNSKKKYYGT